MLASLGPDMAVLFCFVLFCFVLFFFGLFAFSRAAPAAYGASQARGPIGAAAAGYYYSHSNTRSEPHLHLQPAPKLMDPYPTE